MRAGIDKISLHIPEIQIDNLYRTGLEHDKGKENLTTGAETPSLTLTDRAGNKLTGAKFYANGDGYTIDINSRGTLINYNPSKALHPYKLISDPDRLSDTWKHIQDDLRERGINANWLDANVTRIDLAKNITLNNPCFVYDPVWKLIEVKRATSKKRYPDGYSSGNNSQTVIFYNKGKEANAPELGDNTLRGEYQTRKRKAVQKVTGLYTLHQVINAGEGYINEVYSKTMQDKVLRVKHTDNQLYIPFNDIQELMNELAELHYQGAGHKLLEVLGTPNAIELIGIDGYKILLQDIGYSKTAVNNNVKALIKMNDRYSRLMSKKDTVSSLYREIRTKLVA